MIENIPVNLVACPFCGSRNIACEVLDEGWKFVEACRNCKARGPMYRTMPEALSGWNGRVPDTELTLQLAQARQHLDYLWRQAKMCPCGARLLSEQTHPHVGGCPTGLAVRAMEAADSNTRSQAGEEVREEKSYE